MAAKKASPVYSIGTDSITIDMPGRFDGFFSGSSVGQGCDEGSPHPGGMGYPGGLGLYTAYSDSTKITRGKGYSLRLTIPRDEHLPAVLDCLRQYADTCYWCNQDNASGDNEARAEARAGETMRARVDELLAALDRA